MRFGVYSRIRKKSEDEITIIESVSNCSADRTKNYLHLCTIGRQYSWGQNWVHKNHRDALWLVIEDVEKENSVPN